MEQEKYNQELLSLVRMLTEKYTGRESTSITVDKARQLMHSVLYCIQEYQQEEANQIMETDKNRKETSYTLRNGQKKVTLAEQYRKGYESVLAKVHMAKKLYEETLPYFDDYGNRAVHDTVLEGMPAFFTTYDPRFNPQNAVLTWDYPMLRSFEHLEGIDRIYALMKCIQLEQQFLSALPREYIVHVLEQYHADYKELFINICGIVMGDLLLHGIAGKALDNTDFNEKDLQIISAFVQKYDRIERKARLEKILAAFIGQHYAGVVGLYEYLACRLEDFSVELENDRRLIL